MHEVDPEHLWQGEGDEAMADVFENFVFEKCGESGGALGIA